MLYIDFKRPIMRCGCKIILCQGKLNLSIQQHVFSDLTQLLSGLQLDSPDLLHGQPVVLVHPTDQFAVKIEEICVVVLDKKKIWRKSIENCICRQFEIDILCILPLLLILMLFCRCYFYCRVAVVVAVVVGFFFLFF